MRRRNDQLLPGCRPEWEFHRISYECINNAEKVGFADRLSCDAKESDFLAVFTMIVEGVVNSSEVFDSTPVALSYLYLAFQIRTLRMSNFNDSRQKLRDAFISCRSVFHECFQIAF